MLLDVFFDAAVPLAVVTLVVAKVVLSVNKKRPFYDGEEGQLTRDEVNKKYNMNKRSVVILLIMFPVYALVVASLFDEWGNRFFTYVISVLIALPFGAVAVMIIALYHLFIHGRESFKKRH